MSTEIIKKIVFILLLFYFYTSYNSKKEDLATINKINKEIKDSLYTYKDKNNQLVSEIKVIQANNEKYFLSIESYNKEIQSLQKLVKKYKDRLKKQGSATVIELETKIDTIIANKTISEPFTQKISSKWYETTIQGKKDSLKLTFKTYHKLNLVIGQKRKNLFKSEYYAVANDENPYSNIKSMRVYQVKMPKQKKLGIGMHLGYDIFNNALTFSFGLNFNLLNIR